MQILINLAILVLGFFMLAKGSDWFVDGAAGVADRLRIPPIIVGLTIVAMGTSLPEASVSIVSASKGSAGIAIGNVLGSNIMNILLILGITSAICLVPVGIQTLRADIPVMIFVTIVLAAFSLAGGSIQFYEGVLMWVIFIAYLTFLVKKALKNRSETSGELPDNSPSEVSASSSPEAPGAATDSGDQPKALRPLPVQLLLIVIGAALIIGGSNLTVDAATAIARIFGISERIIGLTIVAFGTSLPELFTSATAALKGQTDIAIGNIVGSNIFNILFVLGSSALVTTIPFSADFIPDMVVAIFASFLLLILCLWKKGLDRVCGAIMLAGYAGYFVYLLKG